MTTPTLVEHFFRHEYGKLVATLSCRIGVHHIEAVEDAVQSALMSALESWTVGRLPDNPSAWLFRVAHNNLMGGLRLRAGRRRILEQSDAEDDGAREVGPEIFLAGEMQDNLLRMLFVCCDEAVPVESQLVLALKTLCGFNVGEIAHRLFISEANVYKRLGRARGRLRDLSPGCLGELSSEHYVSRLRRCTKSSTSSLQRATSRPTRSLPSDGSSVTKRFGSVPSWRSTRPARFQRPLPFWL